MITKALSVLIQRATLICSVAFAESSSNCSTLMTSLTVLIMSSGDMRSAPSAPDPPQTSQGGDNQHDTTVASRSLRIRFVLTDLVAGSTMTSCFPSTTRLGTAPHPTLLPSRRPEPGSPSESLWYPRAWAATRLPGWSDNPL